MTVVDGTFNWVSNADHRKYVPVTHSGKMNDSAVLLADGRVLYVWGGDQDVKQAYAPDVNTFITQDASVGPATVALATFNPSATVCWVGDELVMAVVHSPAAGEFRTQIYKSPGKAGGDWTLFSTVQTYTGLWDNQAGALDASRRQPSEIFVTSTGRWLLHACHWEDWAATTTACPPAVWASSDAGLTWTRVGHGYQDPFYSDNCGRKIMEYDGALWCNAGTEVATKDPGIIIKSTDGGTTWTKVYGGGDLQARRACFGLKDNNAAYIVHMNASATAGVVERTTAIEPFFTNWAQHRDYTTPDPTGGVAWNSPGPIIQKLGSQFVYMCSGVVVGIGKVGAQGWWIGHIPMY